MNPARICVAATIALFIAYIVCILSQCSYIYSAYVASGILLFALLGIKFYSTRDRKGTNRYGYIYLIPSYILASLTVTAIIYVGYEKSLYHHKESFYLIGQVFGLFLLPTTFLLYYRMILAFHCVFHKLPDPPPISDEKDLPGCSIILSTRNEPFDVCKMTLDSATNLKYAKGLKEIIVIDNSDTAFPDYLNWKRYVEDQNKLNNGCVYKFIHRDGTDGFKPKNLDIAMRYVKFDYIMFLDADSTLLDDTLLRTMPEFKKDEKLGFLTLMLKSTNANANFFAKICSIFQNMIRYLNEFNGQFGYCNFQGHNAIWSAKALQKVGPWLEMHRGETMVIEDVAAAFRCYANGFYSKSVYIDSGEWVPMSLKEFESMWMRWSYGGMQIFSKYMFKICKSRTVGLKVKLDMLYLIFKMAASVFPILSLFCVIFPQSSPLLITLILLTLLPSIVIMVSHAINIGLGYTKFTFKAVLDLYLAFFVLSTFVLWCSIKAEMNYYLRKKQGWKPTGKSQGASDSWWSIIKQNYGKIVFSLVGLGFFIHTLFVISNWGNTWVYIVYMIPSALFFFNTLLAVILFGKSGKVSQDKNVADFDISVADTHLG
ncbi:glycosyltransferase family 2 protein [Francisellaceae bacterium]|nr:glycosyltransferase family 2 protein [Francisellaceae bacterium]